MSVTLKMNGGADNVNVSAATFEAEYNEALIHQVVVAYQAGGRAGTAAQKTRSQVSGGGAKPWRQKGTGRARAGTIRSPIFRGGGKVFAAATRDYTQKVNRKMYRAAIRSILSELNRQERLVVIDDFSMDKPKTKELNEKLAKLGATSALLVLSEDKDFNVALSARNIMHIEVCGDTEVNPVNLISYEKVIITKSAIAKIDEVLK